MAFEMDFKSESGDLAKNWAIFDLTSPIRSQNSDFNSSSSEAEEDHSANKFSI